MGPNKLIISVVRAAPRSCKWADAAVDALAFGSKTGFLSVADVVSSAIFS